MPASMPDLLRLLAVVVLAWAAYRDIRTRRVSNRTWPPLAVLAVALLAWEGAHALSAGGFEWRLYAIRVAISLGIVAPAGYLFYRLGAFGGADAKALIVLAVLFPTYPTYAILGTTLPHQVPPLGVFSLTILSNAVLVGVAYPLALAARNAVRGRIRPAMIVGLPVAADRVPITHGRLLETRDGFTRSGLDLDALRMYLRWRGLTFAELRADPDRYRDPTTLPETPRSAGDGAIDPDGRTADYAERAPDSDGRSVEFDGRTADSSGLASEATVPETTPTDTDGADEPAANGGATRERDRGASDESETALPAAPDDEWGAEAFLEAVGSAYGTTPGTLREGIELLVEREDVWVSPGIPFLVPLFLGLVLALTYGDLLYAVLSAIGIA